MEKDVYMKAPKGTTGALIEGHEYDLSKKGVIKVKQESHIETLKRHGFTETDGAGEIDVDAIEDKDELVRIVEEHGGDADNSMSLKKLRRLAREAIAESEEA